MNQLSTPECIPVLGQTSYLCIPFEVNVQSWELIEKNLYSYLNAGKKVRIIWENPIHTEIINHILETLEVQILGLHFNFYPTRFYKIDKLQLSELLSSRPELDWNTYQEDFKIIRVTDPKQPEFSILEDFCKSSNGVEFVKSNDGKTNLVPNPTSQKYIQEQLPVALANGANHMYVVAKIKPNLEYVGTFDLVDFKYEWQLHYTSGKTNIDKKYIFPSKKMPVLAAAIFHLMENEIGFDRLTFSSKDDATKKIYTDVGFELFEGRRCVVAQVK